MLRVKTLNFSTLVDSQFPNCFLALIILNLNLIFACNIYINSLIYTNFLLELFLRKKRLNLYLSLLYLNTLLYKRILVFHCPGMPIAISSTGRNSN